MMILKFLFDAFSKFRTGTVVLPYAHTTLEIHLGFQPAHVWIEEQDANGIPVCHGKTNSFNVYKTTDGFLVVADVESEWSHLSWVAYAGC